MNKKYITVSITVFAVAVIAAAVLYFAQKRQSPVSQNQQTATPNAVAVKQSLGGQIYEQAANPLSNKLPDANPAKNANPIQGLNVNPF